jgi:hypothetical protein
MTLPSQNGVVFLIGMFMGGLLLRRFFRVALAPLLAKALLKRGRVRWAMWFRGQGPKNSKCH